MKVNGMNFPKIKNEEKRMLPDIEISDHKQRARKRKKIDDNKIDITHQDLSSWIMMEDDLKYDDILCDYLNILIPSLTWRVNKKKGFPEYEIVNLTQKQAEIVKIQLKHVLHQSVVAIEPIHEMDLQNYRLLISDIDIKYLKKMSVRLHRNCIWLPSEEEIKKIMLPGSMFEYRSSLDYNNALKNRGIYSTSLRQNLIQKEFNLLCGIINLEIPGMAENSAIQQLAMKIVANQEKETKNIECLLAHTLEGNYWLFRWYLLKNIETWTTDNSKDGSEDEYKDKDKAKLLMNSVIGGNIEIVRDLIGSRFNWNVFIEDDDDFEKYRLSIVTPVLLASIISKAGAGIDIFKLLVATGADVNFLGDGGKRCANVFGNIIWSYPLARFLIASAEPCLSFSYAVGSKMLSPLDRVASNDKIEIAKLLIDNGARLTQKWLDFAIVESGSVSLMQCMVKNFPLVVLQRDQSGNTPLHISARQGYSPLVRYLIEQAPQCLLLKNSDNKMPIDYLERQFQTILQDLELNSLRTFKKISKLLQSDYKKEENRVKKISELTHFQVHSQVKKPKKPVAAWDYSSTPAYIQYADYVRCQGENPDSFISQILSVDMDHSGYDVLLEYLRSLMPLLSWMRNPRLRTPAYEIRDLNENESSRLMQHLKLAFLGYPVRIAVKKQTDQQGVFWVRLTNLSLDLLQLAARQLLQHSIFVIKDADFMGTLFLKDVLLTNLLPYLDMFDYEKEEYERILLNFGVPVCELDHQIEMQWQNLENDLPYQLEESPRKKLVSRLREIDSKNGESEFYNAIKNNDFWLYRAYIHKRYVNIDLLNDQQLPVIFNTVRYGNLAMIRDAIAAGAALNSFRCPEDEEENIFFEGCQGDETRDVDPLYIAIEQQKYAALKLLVAAGINVNNLSVQNNVAFQTSLQVLLEEKGDLEPVQFMVESGAALNYSDDIQDAPLSIAIDKCYYQIASYLISQGAEINKITSKGETLLHLVLNPSPSALLLPSFQIKFFIYLLDVLKLSLLEKDYKSERPLDLIVNRGEDGQTLLHHWARKVSESELFAYAFIRLAHCPHFAGLCISDEKGDTPLKILQRENRKFWDYFEKNVIPVSANLQKEISQSPLTPSVSEMGQFNLFPLPVSPYPGSALQTSNTISSGQNLIS